MGVRTPASALDDLEPNECKKQPKENRLMVQYYIALSFGLFQVQGLRELLIEKNRI